MMDHDLFRQDVNFEVRNRHRVLEQKDRPVGGLSVALIVIGSGHASARRSVTHGIPNRR
jgi:hypothetical protein